LRGAKTIEQLELDLSLASRAGSKAALGQFMTPDPIARFMASLFSEATHAHVKLLDAGAGEGALTRAFLQRWTSTPIEVHAYEIDAHLSSTLTRHLAASQTRDVTLKLRREDFLEAVTQGGALRHERFTHAILNPPYKKISATSGARRAASSVGLETVNLYAAFVGLALAMLEPGAELVAIIPRSFCSGPYDKPFRRWLFEYGALRRLHLFDSRTQPFSAD
jgi:predicted RNA methylase